MHLNKSLAAFASVAAAALLVACGGGGSGGNDPVALAATGNGTTSQDASIKAGEPFSFTVVANSPDNKLSKLSWTMQSSAGAPTLAVSNLDCAVAERTDTPRLNDLVSSVWKCTINGATPALVEKDAVYTFTAVATNTKNSTSSISSVLKVAATPADALVPKVEIDAPIKVAGGTVNDLSCNATSRFPTTPAATYTYSWTSSTFDGKQVTFDSRSSQKVKATFPRLSANTSLIVTCSASDAAGNAGQASAPIEVTQSAPGVTITGTASGTAGESIALTCAADNATTATKYSWSSVAVNGANLSFDSTTRSVVSVTLPNVTKATSIVATCEVTDEFGATGQAAKAISVAPVPTPPATGASGTT